MLLPSYCVELRRSCRPVFGCWSQTKRDCVPSLYLNHQHKKVFRSRALFWGYLVSSEYDLWTVQWSRSLVVSDNSLSSVRNSLSLTNQRRFMRLIHDRDHDDNMNYIYIIMNSHYDCYNSHDVFVPMAAGSHRNTFWGRSLCTLHAPPVGYEVHHSSAWYSELVERTLVYLHPTAPLSISCLGLDTCWK